MSSTVIVGQDTTVEVDAVGRELAQVTISNGNDGVPPPFALAIEDEGVEELAAAKRLNFTGAGVSVNVTGDEAEIIIPGGGGGMTDPYVPADGIMNVTGGITATDNITLDGNDKTITVKA